jgi:hypothetical protein
MAKMLASHDEIRSWVEARAGEPILEDIPDVETDQVLLSLTFGQHALNADHNEGPDPLSGWRLVSWEEWFDALDRQQLGLKVNDEVPGMIDHAFELVARTGEGETTDAARQPAAETVELPRPTDLGAGEEARDEDDEEPRVR